MELKIKSCLVDNKSQMGTKFLNIFLLLFTFIGVVTASYAQRNPGYFGRKNIISVSNQFYWRDAFGPARATKFLKGEKVNKLSLQLNYERNIGAGCHLGVSFSANDYTLNDRADFYEDADYFLMVNGKTVPVERGVGKIMVKETSAFVFFKRFSQQWTVPLYGLFYSWKLGLSNYEVSLDENYTFVQEFDGGYKRFYKASDNHVVNYRKLTIGYELGRNARLFHDRLMLTYSFTIPLNITMSRTDNPLSKFYVASTKNYINNYKAIYFNLSFGYVL